MSDHVWYLLGYTLDDLDTSQAAKVSTAKEGADLDVLGQPPWDLTLKVPRTSFAVKIRPKVVRGLTMALNLSGPWMKQNRWDQLHSQDAVSIQGNLVPLCKDDQDEWPAAAIHGPSEDEIIPAGHIRILSLSAPLLRETPALHGWGVGTLDPKKLSRMGLKEGPGIIDLPGQDGRVRVSIMNPGPEDQKLENGPLGHWRLLQAEGHQEPWRIGVARLDQGQKKAEEPDPPNEEQVEAWFARQRNDEDPSPDEYEVKKRPTIHTSEGRMRWFIEQYKLDKNPVLAQFPDGVSRAAALLAEYWDVFAHDGVYEKTNVMQHIIDTGSAAPIKCRYRAVSPTLEDNLRQQLDQWLEQGIIEPANSPWSANLVAVTKKNGTIRWCVNYRALNEVTTKDTFPMPQVPDIIAKLAGAEILSQLDASQAFNVVEIRKADRPKTAFATPWGSFQNKRMGFGVTNGPATYCRVIEKVFRKIPPSVAVAFMDDGVVHSPNDLDQHFQHLRITLDAYRKANLKLNWQKCSFFQSQICYLGHTVSRRGVSPVESYAKAVQRWKMPQTKSQLRKFLGMVNYYRRFIKDFSEKSSPLTDLLSNKVDDNDLAPGKEAIQAFEVLKESLVTAPVMGFPYFRGPRAGPFILDTDYSGAQVGSVLSQIQDDQEVVIAYGSKKLGPSQRTYASTKGELYAGYYFMNYFSYYLKHREFIWRTDNRALTYINRTDCAPVLQRWLEGLAHYQFKIQFRQGRKHRNADTLSRYDSVEEPGRIGAIKEGPSAVATYEYPFVTESLREAQEMDDVLRQVRKWVEEGETPLSPMLRKLSPEAQLYASLLPCLSLSRSGTLMYLPPNHHSQPAKKGKAVPCLPYDWWDPTIDAVHKEVGHMKTTTTTAALRKTAFFPGLAKEVARRLKACLGCQTQPQKVKPQRAVHKAVQAGYVFQHVYIDHVGPLTAGCLTGSRYLLTARCSFSKWTEAFPMQGLTALETCRTLEKEIFCRFGPPESLISDNSTTFSSALYKGLCRLYGVKTRYINPYNPRANHVERMHKDLVPMLRALNNGDASSWEEVLPRALYALRIYQTSTTKLSPYQVVFGNDPSTSIDLLFGNYKKYYENSHVYHEEMRKTLRQLHQYVRENLDLNVQRTRRRYLEDKRLFAPGTKVWLFTFQPKPNVSRKLQNYWTGPWIVCGLPIHDVMCRIAPDAEWGNPNNTKVVSVDRLRLYGEKDTTNPSEDYNVEMEDDPFAENLIREPKAKRARLERPPSQTPPSPRPGDSDDDDDDDDDDDQGKQRVSMTTIPQAAPQAIHSNPTNGTTQTTDTPATENKTTSQMDISEQASMGSPMVVGTPVTNAVENKVDESLMSYQENEEVELDAPKYKEPGPHRPDPLEQSSMLVPVSNQTPAPKPKPRGMPKARPMPKDRPKQKATIPKKKVGFHPAQNLDFSYATSEEEAPKVEESPPFYGFENPVTENNPPGTPFCPTVHSTPAVAPRARTVTPSWPVRRPTRPKNPRMRMLPARLTDYQYQQQKRTERRGRHRQLPRRFEDYDLELSEDDSNL